MVVQVHSDMTRLLMKQFFFVNLAETVHLIAYQVLIMVKVSKLFSCSWQVLLAYEFCYISQDYSHMYSYRPIHSHFGHWRLLLPILAVMCAFYIYSTFLLRHLAYLFRVTAPTRQALRLAPYIYSLCVMYSDGGDLVTVDFYLTVGGGGGVAPVY